MRKNFGVKPYTYPQPVFVIATYGPDGTPDAMNAAWPLSLSTPSTTPTISWARRWGVRSRTG